MRAVASASSFTLTLVLLAFTMFVIVTTEFVVVGLLPAMAKDLNLSLAEHEPWLDFHLGTRHESCGDTASPLRTEVDVSVHTKTCRALIIKG